MSTQEEPKKRGRKSKAEKELELLQYQETVLEQTPELEVEIVVNEQVDETVNIIDVETIETEIEVLPTGQIEEEFEVEVNKVANTNETNNGIMNREKFEAAIRNIPYSIYVDGTVVAHYSAYLQVEAFDDYFTVFTTKYQYTNATVTKRPF